MIVRVCVSYRMMKKWIYVNVLKLGNSDDKIGRAKDDTNDWYVIKPKAEGDGADEEVEISRVFEEVASMNNPNFALRHTICEAIGSCIYVIGGECLVCEADPSCHYEGCYDIRCIDTQNPKQGWQTCFNMPIKGRIGRSALVDNRWLCVFPFPHHIYSPCVDPNYPCLAFDVVEIGRAHV